MTEDSNDRLSVGPLPRADQITADFSHLDPTLDACCRRDAEDSLKAQSKRAVLQQHDRVAAYEKTRRGQQHNDAASTREQLRNPHLVSVSLGPSSSQFFDGCRCSYDPTKDGGADYPALAELRRELQQPEISEDSRRRGNEAIRAGDIDGDSDSDDELDAFMEGFGGGAKSKEPRDDDMDGSDDNENDSDDDDLLLLMDDGPVSDWERQRKQQLLQQLQSLEAARQHGYGGHRPMHPTRVLKVAGLSQSHSNTTANSRIPPAAVIIHLYDPDSAASASLDLYFEQTLATHYPGTMFLRSDGRRTARVERDLLAQHATQCAGGANSHVGRSLMQFINEPEDAFPALLVVRHGHAIHVACGFHRPSTHWIDPTSGRVIPSAVEEWLERSSAGNDDDSILRRQPPSVTEICHLRPEELALLDYLRTSNNNDNDDMKRNEFHTALECNRRANGDEIDSFYDCGLPGCRKPYHHQHVGMGGGGDGSSDENNHTASGGLPSALLDDGAAASCSLSTDN
jgi:hypothetical protein